MSECDSLSRPTWVLGAILRKERRFHSGIRVTDSTVCTMLWILLTDLVSTLYFLQLTPPGFTEFPPALIRTCPLLFITCTSTHPPHLATEFVSLSHPLFRVTEGNGTRHTCVSVPFLLLLLFYS